MSFIEHLRDWMNRYYKLLLLLALVLALSMRLVNLNQPSLTDNEAQLALQAFGVVKGQSTNIGGQPGYVALTSLLFFIFGSSNFFARLWPALFGAGLVLVPCLFRKHMDDEVGVLLAFIIALEPGLIALSRTADGAMITITALLTAIGFLFNKKIVPSGILFAVSMAGSEKFWPLVLALGITGLVTSFKKEDKKPVIQKKENPRWQELGITFLITLLLISSQFFLYPKGISGIGSGFVNYLKSWQQSANLSVLNFLLVCLSTQLPAIILAIWALISGLKIKSKTTRFLGFWWGIGLILGVLNPSLNTLTAVMINLPVFLLAAIQINRIIEKLVIHSNVVSLVEFGATVSLLLFSVFNLLNLVNFPSNDPILIRNRLIGTLLPLALWIAFTMLMAWGWDLISTRSGLIIGTGLLLLAVLAGSGWKAAGLGSRPENELLASPGFITGEESLSQSIAEVSRWNYGQAASIDVDVVGLNSPSLIWALRNLKMVTADSVFPTNTTPSIVISSLETMIQTQTLYRGQLVSWSVQPDWFQMKWQDWIKWGFLRIIPQQKESIILWVRNDLFKGQTQTQ